MMEQNLSSQTLKARLFRLLDLLGISGQRSEDLGSGDLPDEEFADEMVSSADLQPLKSKPVGTVVEKTQSQLDEKGRRLLKAIQKYSSSSNEEDKRRLARSLEEFRSAYADREDEVEKAIARGKKYAMWKQIRWAASGFGKVAKGAQEKAIAEYRSCFPGVDCENEIAQAIDEGKYRKTLKDIRYYASWAGTDGERKLQEASSAFRTAYPDNAKALQQAITQGKELQDILEEAYTLAKRFGKDSDKVKQFLELHNRRDSGDRYSIKKRIETGDTAFQRREFTRQKSNRTRSEVKARQTQRTSTDSNGTSKSLAMHASNPQVQEPASKWTIVIDESGSEFGANINRVAPQQQGRFVAVAIPGEKPELPPLEKGWHAAERIDPRDIDYVFQTILDKKVAVFGVTMTAVPSSPGERWVDGVTLLVDWLLRLLPIDGPTKIEVLIENRGTYERGLSWQLVERECLRRMAAGFASTAAWIDLHIETIGKNDSPYGGYADALAYTWARTNTFSEQRLAESQLVGSCLLEIDSHSLLSAWNAFAQGVHLPGPNWWQLLPQTADPTGLVWVFLNRVGSECRAQLNHWTTYLNETRHQMTTGTVDLDRLAQATEWLEIYMPADQQIPPLLRLSWLTVKLARSNHYGDAETAWEQELEKLALQLVEEAAPQVCHADLHLAVARTNRYDFDGATRALQRWADWPVQVPGLRYWAQVKSSLGQHEAFRGNPDTAVAYFDEALAAFARLSDADAAQKDSEQTGTYRAIALMDDPNTPDDVARAAVENLLGPVDQAVKKLASSSDSSLRYFQHLLVRWLTLRGTVSERQAYLVQRDHWHAGSGHPWQLIQFYRALLLADTDPQATQNYAKKAIKLANTPAQGPVVRLIGLTCLAITTRWGLKWTDRNATTLDEVETALPAAASHISVLRDALHSTPEPRALLTQVLPFNFH